MPDREKLTYHAYRTAGAFLQHLPGPVAGATATAVGLGLAGLRRDARALYARHLRRVLGPDLSDAEVREMTRRAFVSYARYWFEGARLSSTSPEKILGRMWVKSGFDHLVTGTQLGNGVIMALPHVGSWEWGGAWLALNGFPMTSVAEPLASEDLYEWFVKEREAMGLTILKLDDEIGASLLRVLRAGRLVGLLCDRDLGGNGVEVEFFGEKTTLPAGPATLAIRTGAALLPTAVYSGPGRDHTGLILPPIPTTRTGRLREDVARITQLLAHDLERLIRRAPEQWHLFQPNWPSDTDGVDARREGRSHLSSRVIRALGGSTDRSSNGSARTSPDLCTDRGELEQAT